MTRPKRPLTSSVISICKLRAWLNHLLIENLYLIVLKCHKILLSFKWISGQIIWWVLIKANQQVWVACQDLYLEIIPNNSKTSIYKTRWKIWLAKTFTNRKIWMSTWSISYLIQIHKATWAAKKIIQIHKPQLPIWKQQSKNKLLTQLTIWLWELEMKVFATIKRWSHPSRTFTIRRLKKTNLSVKSWCRIW